MISKFNIASLVSIVGDELNGIYAIDFNSGKFYSVPLQEVDEKTAEILRSSMQKEVAKNVAQVPDFEIGEVIKAQKEVQEKNKKDFNKVKNE